MHLPASRSSKSFIGVLIALIIVLMVIGGVWYAFSVSKRDSNFDQLVAITPIDSLPAGQAGPSPLPTPSPTPVISPDMQSSLQEIDTTDIDSLDTDLRALDADARQL